jgi:hypothetical protein
MRFRRRTTAQTLLLGVVISAAVVSSSCGPLLSSSQQADNPSVPGSEATRQEVKGTATAISLVAPTVAPTSAPVPTNTPAPTPTPTVAVAPVTSQAYLTPMVHMWQTLNNCGPCSVAMALSYYGVEQSQAEVAAVLRPDPNSHGMSPAGLPSYLAQFDLSTVIRINGKLDLVKALVSNGVPVIVSQIVKPDEPIGHYRLVRGFDDAKGVVIVNDSLVGENYQIPYAEFDSIWRTMNYRYIPVYRPESEPLVKAIVGADWDDQSMYAKAERDAEAAVAGQPADGYLWNDLGDDRFNLGDYKGAVEAWEKTVEVGVPETAYQLNWRLASAYNRIGQYDEALSMLSQGPLGQMNSGRLYYERGRAYEGLGRRDEAASDYRKAIELDPTLKEAKEALDALTGGADE